MRGGRVLMAAGFLTAGLFVALAGGQAQDNKAQPPKSAAPPGQPGAHDKMFEHCAKACSDCALECERCGKHCQELVAAGHKEHQTTVGTCCDCAAICLAAMKSAATKGPFRSVRSPRTSSLPVTTTTARGRAVNLGAVSSSAV